MLCFQLLHSSRLNLTHRQLAKGSTFEEPRAKPRLTRGENEFRLLGHDSSINHMLADGNGFPPNHFFGTAAVIFDVGCRDERRDLKSMQAWMRDLQQAARDKLMGRTD